MDCAEKKGSGSIARAHNDVSIGEVHVTAVILGEIEAAYAKRKDRLPPACVCGG